MLWRLQILIKSCRGRGKQQKGNKAPTPRQATELLNVSPMTTKRGRRVAQQGHLELAETGAGEAA